MFLSRLNCNGRALKIILGNHYAFIIIVFFGAKINFNFACTSVKRALPYGPHTTEPLHAVPVRKWKG